MQHLQGNARWLAAPSWQCNPAGSSCRTPKVQCRHRGCAPMAALFQTQVGTSWVTAPPGKPRGVIHFEPGAFVGAAPQLTYQLLIQLLSGAGYTVIATPYAVTFRHIDCAAATHAAFQQCMQQLRQTGQGFLVEEQLPVHGVGHSNGALLHLLIGSQFPINNKSNILMSFNNQQVKAAIPVPLTGLQDALRSSQARGLARQLPRPEVLLQRAAAVPGPLGGMDAFTRNGLSTSLAQLDTIFSEIEAGTTEFTPTPSESRALISRSYSVPRTLLVRFADDSIDATADIAPVLKLRHPEGTVDVTLPGNHITPCGTDSVWQVGSTFSPVDALRLAAKAFTQRDIRRAADQMIAWLDA